MTKKDFAINAMRRAIIEAQKTGNRHAIYLKDATKLGITEERWYQWKLDVAHLQEVVTPYVKAAADGEKTDEELTKLRRDIFPTWRKILKTGEEDIFHPKMFVRKADVDELIGLGKRYLNVQDVGSVQAEQSEEIFRKGVERLIGCRISGLGFLDATEADIIEAYQFAKSKAKRLMKELDGETTKKGYMPGIIKTIETVENSIKEMIEKRTAMEAMADMAEGDLRTFVLKQIDSLNEEKIKTEGQLADLKNQRKLKEEALADAKAIIEKTETEAVKQIEDLKARRK